MPCPTAGAREWRRPPTTTQRVERALAARPEELIARGIVRRRRSLLLHLEHQVTVDEQPWVRAVAAWCGDNDAERAATRCREAHDEESFCERLIGK